MLATAAAMAGGDGAKGERLPDSSGMKSEVLIQAGHRYKYDRQVLMAGARLVEVGSQNGTRPDQMIAAITDQTAMVIHPAHLDGKPGTIALEHVVALAHQRGVPVFVDAAYMVYPPALMGSYLKRGADLVAISSKYFGGPMPEASSSAARSRSRRSLHSTSRGTSPGVIASLDGR